MSERLLKQAEDVELLQPAHIMQYMLEIVLRKWVPDKKVVV